MVCAVTKRIINKAVPMTISFSFLGHWYIILSSNLSYRGMDLIH